MARLWCFFDGKEGKVMNQDLQVKYMEGLNEEQKKVFEILVCQIIASKDINEISLFQNDSKRIILSGQEYGNVPDEDMSDFSVGFYKKLYNIEMNDSFIGDTMNSFNAISKYASKEKKKEWKAFYHCLANFWVLPLEIGRKAGKYSKGRGAGKVTDEVINFNKGMRDYMDRFLMDLKSREDEYGNAFKDYFEKFEDFRNQHYIDEIYMDNQGEIIKFSIIDKKYVKVNEELIDSIIDKMIDNIYKRAVNIAKSKKSDELLEYFKECSLV